MKKTSIVVTLILALGVSGCGSGSSMVTPPSSGSHGASSVHRLSTATRVVKVTKASQVALRKPKEGLGGIPLVNLVLCLFDAPLAGDGAQVNIALAGINAISNGVATPVVTNATPVVVDLISLQNVAQQYAGALPAGSYDTLQLVVDPNASNVVANGTTYPVQFGGVAADAGSYIGIDAPAAFSATSGTVTVTMDFNVLESVALGSGIASIDPQVVTAPNGSDVTGTLVNAAGQPVSSAAVLALDANGNVLNTTVSGADGNFTLHALPAGSATLVIQNAYVSDSGESVVAQGADAAAAAPVPLAIPGGNTIALGSLTD